MPAMLKFLSFGSGSSGNCYLLETSENSILIDAGVGYRKMKKHFAEYGVNQEKISAILLTHDHTDHISAVSGLAIYLNVPVYATEIVHHRIRTNYKIHRKLPKELVKPIEKYKPFGIGAFTIEAFDVPHDSADCSGYTICHGDKRFVLVTDCGNITDEVSARALEADYLVFESNYDPQMLENGPYPMYLRRRITCPTGHLSNTEAADFFRGGNFPNLRQIFLCHLSENNNTHELAKAAISQALSGKNIPYHILDRRKVNGFFELT